MQKKLIALAIAGLASGAAFADTNVTVYGVAQITVENAKADSAADGVSNQPSKMRVTSNSSRLGFKGTEELGNGLKAIFQFEAGVNLDGASTLLGGTRDSFVGLSGGFGTIKAGINTSPFRGVGNTFDILGQETLGASGNLTARVQDSGGQRNPGFRSRLENSIKFDSANFAGFNFSAIYGANEAKVQGNEAGTNDHTYGLGLGYANGPIKVGYAYERRNDKGALGLGAVDEESTGHIVGGEFSFGMGRVGAHWQRVNMEAKAGATPGEIEQDAWGVYAGFNLGNGELWANYVDANETEVTGVLATVRNGLNTGAKQFGIGYNYNLSKRTKAYALYSRISNDSAATFDYRETTALGGFGAGADPRAFLVGVRHAF